jgi:hypothetical protein
VNCFDCPYYYPDDEDTQASGGCSLQESELQEKCPFGDETDET